MDVAREPCPHCGRYEGYERPSGDRSCANCGAVWKITSRPPEMPKP